MKGNYNRNELPPTDNDEPVVVNVSVYLSSVLKIDDPTQVIAFQPWHQINSMAPVAHVTNYVLSMTFLSVYQFGNINTPFLV